MQDTSTHPCSGRLIPHGTGHLTAQTQCQEQSHDKWGDHSKEPPDRQAAHGTRLLLHHCQQGRQKHPASQDEPQGQERSYPGEDGRQRQEGTHPQDQRALLKTQEHPNQKGGYRCKAKRNSTHLHDPRPCIDTEGKHVALGHDIPGHDEAIGHLSPGAQHGTGSQDERSSHRYEQADEHPLGSSRLPKEQGSQQATQGTQHRGPHKSAGRHPKERQLECKGCGQQSAREEDGYAQA